ncbi:MAG: DUF3536 domain-containing protein [Candidatus Binatia bacterium]
MRAICFHGHYYQPPREHPWLGVVEAEPSAAPDHDWNARILRECYAPNADARLLDARGRVRGVVDNYAWTSFDVGPTLLSWIATHAPALLVRLRAADAESRARTGFGNAWAQAYNHPILPLCNARDVGTEVAWGAREFELRFGRRPDGMWLPEMAVDVTALEALAAAGITLTMLSPHQARRVRPLGGDDTSWREVTPETLDVRRVYRCRLPSGAAVDVVLRESSISQGLAFGELLRDGGLLVERLRKVLDGADGDALVCAATDGETFGHHHQFGEMAIAYAIESVRRDSELQILGPAAFRALVPPRDEIEIVEHSSWSCVHGVERWRADCGCRVAGLPEWTQGWRAPLRGAIDWLRDELALVFEQEAGAGLRDPWGARERYVDCVVEPERIQPFLGAELRAGATAADGVRARRALELARHALLMQTSCGWFFDDLAGVEATLVIRQAGRALEVARALGVRRETEFVDRLAEARSNVASQGSGADIFRRTVIGRPVTAARVAATAFVLERLGEPPVLPGHGLVLHPRGDEVDVEVIEERTGARQVVRVRPLPGDDRVACEVEGVRYGAANLFLVQRERLLARITADAVDHVQRARREALERVAAVIDPLLSREPALPLELAMMLGYDEAERLVASVETGRANLGELRDRMATLRARGVLLPVRVIGRTLAPHLNALLEQLPDRVEEALAILDVAEAAGVVLDMGPARRAVARWWQATRPETPDDALLRLRDRLELSPDLGA